MFNFIDEVARLLYSRNYSAGIFLDLSKTFDVIDHSMLIQRMDEVGVRGVVQDWSRPIFYFIY